jgi:hypothetical protein
MPKKFPSELAIYCLLGNAVEDDGWLPISSRILLRKLSATPRADQLLSGLEILYALTLHAQGTLHVSLANGVHPYFKIPCLILLRAGVY